VGSKAKLVPSLREWVPETFKTYHEPFLGSGALFFALRPPRAFLSDANTRLTRTFGAIQRELPGVLEPLRVHAEMYGKYGAAWYDHVRDQWSDEMVDAEMAAAFIFLNRTGFNGVYRVNSGGRYNVPAGKFTTPPTVCDEARLTACSAALQTATSVNDDFRSVERRAEPGDFVYMDPPYVVDFTAYTKDGFGLPEQTTLRDLALRLKHKGVHVLLSNSATPIVRELYKDFELREISRSGSVSSNGAGRQRVTELLIR
jgi:DNA adenine methylase